MSRVEGADYVYVYFYNKFCRNWGSSAMTQTSKGTFTQVPNVFIDRCLLTGEVRDFFTTVLRHIGHKGGVFNGSIRDLADLLGLSKDKTHRQTQVLNAAHLAVVERKKITLNLTDLWELNAVYDSGIDVSPWADLKQALENVANVRQNKDRDLSQFCDEKSQMCDKNVARLRQNVANVRQVIANVRQNKEVAPPVNKPEKPVKEVSKNPSNTNKTIKTIKDINNTTGVATAAASQTSKTTTSNTLFPVEEQLEEQPEKKPRNTAKAKLARLEQFNLAQEATIDSIMLLGDCLRGNPLPQVKRADSDYQKALQTGATPLSNRKRKDGGYGYTLEEISRSWLFFKRIAPEGKPWLIADDWWKDKNVDLWVVAKNIDKALAAMEKLEKEHASTQEEETTPDDVTPEQQVPDEHGMIIWTTNPDYDGFSYRNDWKNFRLMTVDEARSKYKYGKLNLHLAPSDFTDIQWKLVQAGIIVENAYQAAS